MQTDATGKQLPTLLGVVAFVLTVVRRQMQQFPAMLGATVHHGKDKTHKTLKSTCNVTHVRGPKNVGRAVQMDPTLLGYATAIMEQRKYWEVLAQKFDKFQILRNNF